MYTIVDPDKAVHPLRNTLTDDDWSRLNKVVGGDTTVSASVDELDAYLDFMYDMVASKLQTVYGTTVLQ